MIGAAVCIFLYILVILPLVDAAKKTEDEIRAKKKLLSKYDDYLQNQKAVEEELGQTAKQYELIQQRLLPGETAQLGAANLQEIVKRISEKDGVAIRSFKILEPKEAPPYRKISIQIEFNPILMMSTLSQFIYDIEHHEKGLMISDMDILVPNIRMPNHVQGNLVISGLMKGVKMKETKQKGKAG